MFIKKQFTVKKKLENKYVFRSKIFLHENILIITFLKKTNFTGLFKRAVYPLNKSYIDLSGFNNPKGEDHESNRAKTERFDIKPIFIGENVHKSPRSLHVKP